MIHDEWRYLPETDDCYISKDGDVTKNGEDIPAFSERGYRFVEVPVRTLVYDHENRGWVYELEKIPVWQLMNRAWFSNWPAGSVPYFLDGDPWNCSIDNLRAILLRSDKIVFTKEEHQRYVFDKRLRGRVEILELDRVVAGVKEAAFVVNGTESGVSRALSGDIPKHRGFTFRWV